MTHYQPSSIPRSLSPTPFNTQPQHLHPTDHNLKGAGRVTAIAVRTLEPRFRKADVSGRSDVPEQIPGRQDSENANRVTSTMSLSDFHKTRPTLFWAKGERKEIKAEEKIRFPKSHGFPLMWRDTVTKHGEAKAVVQAAGCRNQEGVEEYLAVKVVSFDSDEARDRADEEVKTLKNLRHNHIIAFVGCYTSEDTLGILLFPLAKYNLWTYMKTISKHNRAQQDGIITPHKYVSRLKGYFACLCQALLYLHDRENPIKHRDIKPENILIDAFDTVILTDFDISKEYRSREAAVTSGNTMVSHKYLLHICQSKNANKLSVPWNMLPKKHSVVLIVT
jgi:serine/threonine protein kinase